MRSLGLLSLALGATLAACTDAGAHLTFSAPHGPGTITSFQVVLATPEQVPSIGGQRTSPRGLEEQSVSYYLQRTIAGGTHGKIEGVDGFAVRIEPDASMIETQFIPFVLMYEGDKIVAVATYHAADSGMPSPILVLRDEIDKYVLDVEPVAQVDDMTAAAVAQVRTVECFREDQSMFTSGVVWRTASGTELRLLFPDDGGLDATKRALDLDCDQHPVAIDATGRDCDDSRAWFHRDAQETCDGFDTNCDGLQSLVVACDGGPGSGVCADPTTNTGLALCDDRTGNEGACESDPQCLCAANPQGCPRCIVTTELGTSTTMLKPCQPGVGYMHLQFCSDTERCSRVEVMKTGGGWKAKVASDATNLAFASIATNVGSKVFLRVERPEGPGVEIPGQRGTSTGDVMLAITSVDGSTHLLAIDLQFDMDGGTCTGTGPYSMLCYP